MADPLRGDTETMRIEAGKHGPVCLDTHDKSFVGAKRHSNNTGELTAIIRACEWVCDWASKLVGSVLIRYDSEYAAKMATGLWKPRTNKELVERARAALTAAVQRTNVLFMHVRGHSANYGNDKADELAELGSKHKHISMIGPLPASGRACALQFGTPSESDGGIGRNSREKAHRKPRLQYKRKCMPPKKRSKR